LDKVEEYVYFLDPPEVGAWGLGEGRGKPPIEYDSLPASSIRNEEVGIQNPENFDYIKGLFWITGWLKAENFSFYRLQYGFGLNPTHWYQIGEDRYDFIAEGELALWDTSELDGLVALQLLVVDKDGITQIATHYVTIDNELPTVAVLHPKDGATFFASEDKHIEFEVLVSDNIGISRVEFYLNEGRVGTRYEVPFSTRLSISEGEELELSATAYDLAGNESRSEVVRIEVSD
jgi:hypothetical protein